ncbi:T9SS type A sorting domain-containing protein [Bacteroidota bacterium]
MRYFFLLVCLFLLSLLIHAQFAPGVGKSGSGAVSADSSIIKAWATGCSVSRGYVNIAEKELGMASFGAIEDVIGKADGNSVLSLGDSGTAVISFNSIIRNVSGPDFAVFENSFTDDFLELAFVEVSYDSIHFFRFPCISETQTDVQISGFGILDTERIHNLAGKYRARYGTPFDLEELRDTLGEYIDSIRYIRIIDVIGCIQNDFDNIDSRGNMINDPWPTPFESSGFDLEAVALLDMALVIPHIISKNQINLVQDKVNNILSVHHPYPDEIQAEIYHLSGKKLKTEIVQNSDAFINLSDLDNGMYLIQFFRKNKLIQADKIIKTRN